jgi:DNA-binding response OmpR family regulator
MSSISKGWGMDVDNYVTKPFNVDDLAKTVKNVLVFRGNLPQV